MARRAIRRRGGRRAIRRRVPEAAPSEFDAIIENVAGLERKLNGAQSS